jgi:hypothetical protein
MGWMQSQDTKAAESFYGSLEGVLHELRTVTAVRARATSASLFPLTLTPG